MAHAQHPHWLTHEWFELHPRLAAELGKHAVGLSVAAFVLLVAVLLSLFEWAQILPEQIAETVDLGSRNIASRSETLSASASSLRDQFLEQKKAAISIELPDQF